MRTPEYISPTSLALFFEDRTEFYLRYLADNRPPRIPQNRPMAIGSAFDAYIKSYIDKALFGRTEFEFETLFEKQVEPQNRDWALKHGKIAFGQYIKTGALADLMLELGKASHTPRLESEVRDTVNICGTPIPLLGKPDLYFIIDGKFQVIFDWKLNGYCSNGTTSPKPGYVMVRGNWGRDNGTWHKDAQLIQIHGISVNAATTLEQIEESWARQIYTYARVLGEDNGGDYIAGIEQLACKPEGTGDDRFVNIRTASFRSRIGKEYQDAIDKQLIICWTALQTGHIFTDLSAEDNKSRCELLDNYHKAYSGEGPNEDWFKSITRGEA